MKKANQRTRGWLSLLCSGVALLVLSPLPAAAQPVIMFRSVTDTSLTSQALAQEENNGRKSVLLAVASSLILPGMGELYAGNFDAGKYNFIADGVLWLGYAGVLTQSGWIRRDARAFAVEHSGAMFDGKNDQYEVNLGNFMTTEEYNQAKLRNRELDLLYTAPQYLWQWDSDGNRARFKDLRIRSDEWRQASGFIVAALVVNRIISAFAAGRMVSRINREFDVEPDADVSLGVLPSTRWGEPGISLMLRGRF